MFSIQRLTTSQRREKILHLARHELRYLFIGLLLLFILSCFILYYVTYLEKNEDTRAIFSNTALDLTAGAAFIASLFIIKSRKENYDKSFLFLAIGLGLWFCGELTYSYYQILCRVTSAYPTIADLFYLAGYPFVATYFYKSFKVWNETKRVKVYSIIIVTVITAGLVGNHIYLNFFAANGESEIGPECLGPLQYVPLLGTIMDYLLYWRRYNPNTSRSYSIEFTN